LIDESCTPAAVPPQKNLPTPTPTTTTRAALPDQSTPITKGDDHPSIPEKQARVKELEKAIAIIKNSNKEK